MGSVPFLRSGAKSLELMCLGNVGQDSIKCEGGPFIHKVIFTKNAHTKEVASFLSSYVYLIICC